MPLFLPPAEFEGGESWVLGSSLDSVYGGMQCVKTDNKVWEKPNKVHNCDLCPGKWDDPSGAWRLNLAWLTWFRPCLVSAEQKWPQRRAQPGVGAVLPLPWPCPWSSSVCKGDATALQPQAVAAPSPAWWEILGLMITHPWHTEFRATAQVHGGYGPQQKKWELGWSQNSQNLSWWSNFLQSTQSKWSSFSFIIYEYVPRNKRRTCVLEAIV